MIQHPAEHLTSNYSNDDESNIYKLLSIGHLEHEEIFKSLEAIERSRDIDEACGFTLDKAGKNVLELRKGRTDEDYRRAIKIKIISNLSAGTIQEIVDIAEILFEENYMNVRETWNFAEFANEPAALLLSLTDNQQAQMVFFEYIKEIVMTIKAGGVRIYTKIFSEVPESILEIIEFMESDIGYASIRTKMLENKDFTCDADLGAIFADDISYLSIPYKTLDNYRITSENYIGIGVNGISFMQIPTAELRRGNQS